MSTKTITKRVALATVVALGAGVLSLVTVSSANATIGTANGAAGAANTNPGTIAQTLNVATLASTTGSAKNDGTYDVNTSFGLVAVSDLSGGKIAGTTQTATLLSSGAITLQTQGATGNNAGAFTVTGGTLSGTGLAAVNTSATAATTPNTATLAAISVKPATGATSFTVRLYNSGVATADVTNPASGTLVGQIVVSVVPTASNGVVSTAKSSIYYSPDGTRNQALTGDNTAAFATNYKNTSVPWNVTNYASVWLKDAYGTAITDTTGLLTATATNGALVAFDDGTNPATSSPVLSTAFRTGVSPANAAFSVAAPSAAPLTTTVTISYNGTVVGTKTFVFTGPITKVTVGALNKIMRLNHAASALGSYKGATLSFGDAAGNTIYPVANDASYPTSGFSTNSASDRKTVVIALVPLSGTTGYIDWTCGAAASTDNAIVNYTNIDGTVATSNASSVSCANDAVTYAAAYDKSTYTPGSLATLTVTFKDSKGFLATDYPTSGNASSYFSNWTTTNNIVSASGGLLAANPSTTTATSNGAATFTVLLGTSEGTFQTTVNTGSSQGITQTAPAIAALSIASGSTSLNDVLKGIVALIASINKQIAALAKLVTKK
jgi:hypothetical protein